MTKILHNRSCKQPSFLYTEPCKWCFPRRSHTHHEQTKPFPSQPPPSSWPPTSVLSPTPPTTTRDLCSTPPATTEHGNDDDNSNSMPHPADDKMDHHHLPRFTLSKNNWSGLGHMVVMPVHNMTKSSKFYKILTSSWLHQVMSSRVVSSPDAKYRQDTVIW